MKRFLPACLFIFLATWYCLSDFTAAPVFAQTLTVSPVASPSPVINATNARDLPKSWIIDPEVTSIGKNASRSGLLLDWALQNYDWSYVEPGKQHPLIPFWITLRNIVYALLLLIVIVGAGVLIITRGRSVTLRRFLPRFILVAVLVTFSFALVQFLYSVVDIFQGFFIRPGGIPISQRDLLYIGWNYQPFVGLRAIGDENYESAFISLVLVKMTSFTYYVMVGMLLIRKIILWFFIIISPLFPLLLFFYPLRNTAKIWLGEFFRWLLYAPLFAIFLAGLVSIWKTSIPLVFRFGNVGSEVIFPTAVSILLGGPLQTVGVGNSVNLADTFGLYIVALMMLWMVIIFPFILLQIFLDYLSSINLANNALARQIVSVLNRFPPPVPSGVPPPSPATTGISRALPFLRDFASLGVPSTTGLAREIPRLTQRQQQKQTVKVQPVEAVQKTRVERLLNTSIPTMRDVAVFEAARVLRDIKRQKEIARIREMLVNVANPQAVQTTAVREHYANLRERLVKESLAGNQYATSVLNAASTVMQQEAVSKQNITNIHNFLNQLANPAIVASTREREKILEVRERLIKEQESNPLAQRVLSQLTTVIATGKSATESLIRALVQPNLVSTGQKEEISKMRELLTKEGEKGNQLARTMLSVIKEIEQTENVSDVLLKVVNPRQVEEKTVRERFEKIHETLLKEEKQQNPLAVTVLNKIHNLQTATSLEEKSALLTTIKETLIREREQNNQLANYLLSQIPEIVQIGRSEDLVTIDKTLEKAKIEGNPLAEKILHLASTIAPARSQQEIETLLLSLLHTKEAPSQFEDKLVEIKELLATESQKGNVLANTIKSILAKIEKIEALREELLNILTPLRIQESDKRNRYALVRETLLKEEKQHNPLAILILRQSERLAASTSITERFELIKALRESIQNEKEKNNPLATFLVAQIPDLLLSPVEQPVLIQEEFEKFKSEGNPLAIQLSEISHEIYQAKQKEELAKLQTEIVKAEKRGEPLGLLLSQMMTSEVKPSEKPVSLPAANRIQAVSLDDYEAVKKMWIENYQNLDKSGNVEGIQGKKAWIEDDLSLISETIDLLTSQDEEKIAQGMRNVSDILPFLLIGGFSQSEIIAYLKAKQEAAKSVLSEVQKALKEEESTVTIERKHVQTPVMQQMAEPLTTEQIKSPLVSRDIHLRVSDAQRDQIINLTNVPVPDIRTVAKYDEAMLSKNSSHIQEAQKILNELINIANPKRVTNISEQERYQHIRETLTKESKVGNVVAQGLLAATHAVVGDVKQVLQDLLRPTQISAERSQMIQTLKGEIESNADENELARTIAGTMHASKQKEISAFVEVLKKVALPESIASAEEKTVYQEMKRRLTQEAASDAFAADVLAVATSLISKSVSPKLRTTIASLLWEKVREAERMGNTIALSLRDFYQKTALQQTLHEHLSQLLRGIANPELVSDETIKREYQQLSMRLQSLAAEGNQLAKSIRQALHEPADQTALASLFDLITKREDEGDALAAEILTRIKKAQEAEIVFAMLSVLKNLENPASLKIANERERYEHLLDSLKKEAQRDSILAMSMLSAVEVLKKQGDDLAEAKKILALLATQQGELRQEVQDALDYEIKKREKIQALRLILTHINNPDQIPIEELRRQFANLKDTLLFESEHGNAVSVTIMQVADKISTEGLSLSDVASMCTNLYEQLSENELKGNVRASEMLRLVMREVKKRETAIFLQVLMNIADPQKAPHEEQEAYEKLHDLLQNKVKERDEFANTILSLTRVINSADIDNAGENELASLLYSILKQEEFSNQFARTITAKMKTSDFETDELEQAILDAAKRQDKVALDILRVAQRAADLGKGRFNVPSENRIQEVSLDDYEAVRAMWTESYRNLDVPMTLTGVKPTRREWIMQEIELIEKTIELLLSGDDAKVASGMQSVANILPFLLIGGFSLSEIVAYLKAKLQAAKTVLTEIESTKEDHFIESAKQKSVNQPDKAMEKVN